MIEVKSNSVEDTTLIAERVAALLQPGDLILASGDLGAGKTTFAKGLGAALGVNEQITSPTFVLLCSYSGRIPFHHVDAYRLEQLQEVIEIGLLELLDDGGVALIEWGDVVAPVLPNDYLAIDFSYTDDTSKRHIDISTTGAAWQLREKTLGESLLPWLIREAS